MPLPARSGADPCCACANSMLATGIERGCQAEAGQKFLLPRLTGYREHIGGYYHIEPACIPHQQCCHGIDNLLLVSNVGVARMQRI